MSETYRTFKTVSSTSKVNSMKNRPNSANSRTTNTTIQLQKREKLKSLLIEKFVKKFSAKEYKYLIEAEVSDFITKEKLTEIDLKNFENHLAYLINGNNIKRELKQNLDNYSSVSELEIKNAPKNYSEENKLNNRNPEGNSVSNANGNWNNLDERRNLNQSTLNKKNISNNKNTFLKPAATINSGSNHAIENNRNNKNYNFEKQNKIIIHKNSPTVINKNNNSNNNLKSNFNDKKNISNSNNYIPNKDQTESLKPIKNQEFLFNDNISRISNDARGSQAKQTLNNSKKNNLNLENHAELDSRTIFKPNSRPMSVRNLNPKNLKLETQDAQDEEDFIDLDVEGIKNFELKKLFKNEQKPLERLNFESEADEWQAIENYKKSLHQSKMAESRKMDWETKMKNREAFDRQMQEKAVEKDKNRVNELAYHEKVMSNIEKLYFEEMVKNKEIEDKKLKEKEFREMQIKESIVKKKKNYLENLKNDKVLLDQARKQLEIEKQLELEKKQIAKENLKKTLEENEEFKRQQMLQTLREREEDKKAMEEYSRMLEKQDNERADYFKRCEEKQKALMSRMKDTVIKDQENHLKEEAMKIKMYQEEKEKKELEEEERKILYKKNSKHVIKDTLMRQMEDKKITAKKEKLEEEKQVQLWSNENEDFFKKDKEKNERIKQLNIMNAEFLKSQMKPKKKNNNEKMNDEEYRLNRDILEEIITSPDCTNRSSFKRNFLI